MLTVVGHTFGNHYGLPRFFAAGRLVVEKLGQNKEREEHKHTHDDTDNNAACLFRLLYARGLTVACKLFNRFFGFIIGIGRGCFS